MTIVPVRNLAKYGIITDVDPYDLPPEAWSGGVNARFRAGKVTRGPVWRNGLNLGTANPRFVQGFTPTSGNDYLFIGYENGTITRLQGGAESNYSVPAYTPSTVEATWTACHLGSVSYINRSDRTPWYFYNAVAFADLSAAAGTAPWSATWSCQVLRAFNSALVALNVTKSSTNFPTMVKTSSFAQAGTVPTSWDQTNPQTSAVENNLAEMEGGIVDGLVLGNVFYIYGQNEVWAMQASGDTFIYNFYRVFTNRGASNANCVIEVNKKHIVFGTDDIWEHDGINQRSICDKRVREFIFGSINASKFYRCFLVHNAALKEIQFCYVSGDRLAMFLNGPDACNRSATWNYEDDTWTFDDLPLVYSGTRANIDTTLTWATATTPTWTTIGGSWIDQEDTFQKSAVFVGDTFVTAGLTASIYAFDPVGPLSQVSWAVDLNATQNMYLERDGIDLDMLGAELKGYKLCRYLIPQGRLDANAAPLEFNLGAADFFNQPPGYDAFQTWDGQSLYKLDFNMAGRFLAMHVLFPDYRYVSLSGYDADLDVLAER